MKEAAVHRLKAAWYHDEELYNKIGQQIIPVTGDFTAEGLNLEKDMMELLQEEFERSNVYVSSSFLTMSSLINITLLIHCIYRQGAIKQNIM